MTKREFFKRAMRLRPSAQEWHDLIERAINYAGCTDYQSAESGVDADVRPLAAAICEYLARQHINRAVNRERYKVRCAADKIFSCL